MTPRLKPAKAGALPGRRRSPCPVACALDILGDKWSLLIVRDMLLGRARFKDFTASPEGIPTNILSERLLRLSERGIIESVPVCAGSSRKNYRLTRKGEGLQETLRSLRDWALRWEKGTRIGLEKTVG